MANGDAFSEQDHPRGCGENNCSTFLEYEVSGSPPRMRGKPRTVNAIGKTRRITPADAGKTQSSDVSTLSATDHPRGCGENSAAKHLTSAGTGSPPRMRGKLYRPAQSV